MIGSAIRAIALSAALAAACAGDAMPPVPRADPPPPRGEALIRHRHGLARVHADLLAILDSVDVIRARPDVVDRELIADFALAYLAMHVDPLLTPAWSSSNPSLEVVDAELRLLEAELLMRLGHRAEAERVLDELDRRFAHRSALVVDYPAGKPSSLREAVRIVRAPRWWAF